MTTHGHDDMRILQEAAQWLDRARRGSAADRHAFRNWLEECPEHAAAMELVEHAWRQAPAAARQAGLQVRARASRGSARTGRALRVPGFALGAALAAFGGLLVWNQAVQDQQVIAPPHGIAVATLVDGTRVWLTAGSTLKVHVTPIGRAAMLTGEGGFDVHHQWRPFTVSAGDVQVVDRGTLFSIARQGAQVDVILARGAVEVQDRGSGTVLATPSPGQKVVVANGRTTLSSVDPDAAMAWREGRIIADDMPLSAIAARFEALGGPHIAIRDAKLGKISVSGTYSAKDAVPFLTALQALYPIVWRRVGDGYEVRHR